MIWLSNKQSSTALSSTEAEYCAATSVSCEASWCQLLEDFGVKHKKPFVIYEEERHKIRIIMHFISKKVCSVGVFTIKILNC